MKKHLLATAAALALAAVTPAHAQPVVRLFELQTPPQEAARFAETARQTLLFAHENEPGTLFMHALRKAGDAQLNYLFEMYRDEAAYRQHTESAAFRHYRAIAPQMISGRKLIEAEPQLMHERGPLRFVAGEQSRPYVRLLRLQARPGQGAALKAALLAWQTHMARPQAGLAALYSVTEKAAPDVWHVLEIHDSQADFRAAGAAAARAEFEKQSAPMLAAQQTQILDAVVLTSKGGLRAAAPDAAPPSGKIPAHEHSNHYGD